jgi:hypothetical protein
MKACRGFICCATVLAVAGFALATPPAPQKHVKKLAVDGEFHPVSGSGAGALCESTGFEAGEVNCDWNYAGMGICGPDFICRDRNVDPPYPACAPPPTANPDNCCVANPGANDWWMSGSAQHCQQPSIDTVNPASGSQHLRFQRSTLGGNPAGCISPDLADQALAANLNCRLSAFTTEALPGMSFNPGVTTTSYDIARDQASGIPGSAMQITQQVPAVGGAYTVITYLGYPFSYDFVLQDFVFLGYFTGGGTYDHFQHIYDVCGNRIEWWWNGMMVHSNEYDGRMNSAEQNVIVHDNNVGTFDMDNFSIVRDLIAEPACPTVCDGQALEVGEDCDGPNFDDCCPDLCGAPGTPEECTCPTPANSVFVGCAPREVFNGVNGPFISDGGLYSYTADAPFTSVDTCAVSYDSQIYWGLTPDCGQYVDFNDDCWEDDYAGAQSPGDPNAACYGGAAPNYQSCVCNDTVPGTAYTFLVAEWAPAAQGGSTFIPPFCSQTIVNIVKKTSCDLGGPIAGGACCDGLTGTCTDGVAAVDCADQYDTYSVNKLCSMVECVAVNGACCNTAPGAGGACVETTQANCPAGQYQTWTVGATCDSVACDEVTGSCCDTISGACQVGVIQGQCAGVWTEGGTCSSCVAATGACCVDDGLASAACSDGQTLAACNAAGGTWTQGTACADLTDPCQPDFTAIPTVSEWGLAVLALMLLIGGKIYFSRREAAMA